MAGMTTSIGLLSGIDYGSIIEQLMAIEAQSRDLVQTRTDALEEEQVAVTELSAYLLSVKLISDNLGKEEVYDKRIATSSNPDVLAATVTGDPPKGTYQFTALQTVQSHQMLSTGVKSETDSLGGGVVTLRHGKNVSDSMSLEHFGGGEGVARGTILITDRSGARAEIDLSTVQTVDDVLDAINSEQNINVTAEVYGDSIRLVDNTGQTSSNLVVQEVGSGTTAASLGLAGINEAASVVDGQDMIYLYDDLDLEVLNDGSGVNISEVLADIQFTLRDGTTGKIDFSPLDSGSSDVDYDRTLGDVLEAINEAAPGKLKAEISDDGERIVITDLTEGTEELSLTPAFGDSTRALSALGLDGESVDGVITGDRILGGAKSPLLSSLNGGNGFGKLGALELSDRNGHSDTVDLSGAETLDEVINIINAADVGIEASVNSAKNGIELRDVTGGSVSNLIIANADATETADKLGIAVDAETTAVDSGDMHLQVVAENTLLADLNGGAGVALGKIKFTDSAGKQGTINLSRTENQTVGDVIQTINRLGFNLVAEINETGDGIRVYDTADGNFEFKITEGDSTTAQDLGLLRDVTEVEIDGTVRKVVDGSMTYTIELEEDDSLQDLQDKINALGMGAQATSFVDGSSKPYRLSIVSEQTGKAGRLTIDTSQLKLDFNETVEAQDALLLYGTKDKAATSILVSSRSNSFTSVLSGVTLDIKQASDQPVTITVDTTDEDLVATVEAMVSNYNLFREALNGYMAYDADSDTRAVLFGDSTALRLDTNLSYMLSGQFAVNGTIKSLAEIGIDMNEEGLLTFDSDLLSEKFADDIDSLKALLFDEEFGLSAKLGELIDGMTSEDENSLLTRHYNTLADQIADNEERITFLDERLETEEERLWTQFYYMELAIGKTQNNLSILESFSPVKPYTGSSS